MSDQLFQRMTIKRFTRDFKHIPSDLYRHLANMLAAREELAKQELSRQSERR